MYSLTRYFELQPLSRQHHNGLLFCLLLKKGLKKHADTTIMQNFCVKFWQEELKYHLEMEEQHFFKLSYYRVLKKKIDKMFDEHKVIKSIFENVDALNSELVLKNLHLVLNKHIRFEERDLFPLIQTTINIQEMYELGEVFKEAVEHNCIHYPIKFWE